MHYKVNLVCIGRLANLFIYLFICYMSTAFIVL